MTKKKEERRKRYVNGGFILKLWLKKKICIALALIMVSVTGCTVPFFGKEKQEVKVQTEGELAMDSIIMRVNNLGVTYREALIYMYQMKERYETGFGTEIWDFSWNEEKTFGEYAKEEIIDNITQIKIIVQQAEKEQVALTEDEVSEISQLAKDYLAGITSDDIKKYGLTEEFIEKVYQDNRLAEKMYDKTTLVVDTGISDEEVKQATIQYFAVLLKGTDRNGKKVKLTKKKEKESALKRAKKLRKQAELAADFGNFADANSELEEYELTYGSADLSNTIDDQQKKQQIKKLPKKILTQGLKMKTGKISNILETEQGYFILYCVSDFDEDATRAKKEEMIEAEQERVFSEAYTSWSKDYKVEIGKKLWEEISFQNL